MEVITASLQIFIKLTLVFIANYFSRNQIVRRVLLQKPINIFFFQFMSLFKSENGEAIGNDVISKEMIKCFVPARLLIF